MLNFIKLIYANILLTIKLRNCKKFELLAIYYFYKIIKIFLKYSSHVTLRPATLLLNINIIVKQMFPAEDESRNIHFKKRMQHSFIMYIVL